MAIIGSKKALDPTAFDSGKLSSSDKLMLFGAMMKDAVGAYNGGDSDALLNAQSLLAGRQQTAQKRQMLGQLSEMAAGGQGGAGGGVALNDPRWSQLALMAPQLGIKLDDFLKLQELNKPTYVNNVRVNPMDPSAPTQIPTVEKGQALRFEGNQPAGVYNLPGSVEAAAAMAGGVEEAKARATAPYQLDTLEGPDGAKNTITRATAAALGARGGLIARGQAPAEQTYGESAARAQVERDFTRPKAEAAIAAMGAKGRNVDSAIDRALKRVSGWSAGMGSVLANVPGTPARDLRAELETIKANLGFEELQTMRDNSPTGGALGQVAVQELEALRSTVESLDQARSPEELGSALQRLKAFRAGQAQRRVDAFRQTYASGSPAAPDRPQTPRPRSNLSNIPLNARMEEARRRGLIP